MSGYCRIYQERVRQEVQPNLALYSWKEFWILCYTRDEAFHLLLSRASRRVAL